MTASTSRYDIVSRALHWVTAAIVPVAFVLGPGGFGRLMRQGVDPATRIDIVWHESLGVAVFALTLLRLLWLAMRPAPPRFRMAAWMQRVAGIVRLALWFLLLALPVTAVLALGSESHPLTLLGSVRVGHLPLIPGSRLGQLTDWGEVHKLMGDVLMWIAGLHAAAGIAHHAVLKDGVLSAMLAGDGR